jgi:tape measure domain-containing protein
MAVDRKEIELIIRAALQGKNNLTDITKSIAELEKAIDKQSAAAKRGESSIDELKATLLQLQQVQDRLKDQAGLIGQYDKLAKSVDKTADRAAKAGLAYDTLNKKLNESGVVTEKQQDRLIRLSVAQDKANLAAQRQREYLAALAASLGEAGIALDDLAGSENKVRQAAAQLGTTILRTQSAINSYADDVRQARDAERELSATAAFNKKAQDAANLVKASQYIDFWENSLRDADIAQEKLATGSALRKAADEAVASAKGYRTLATAIKDVNRPAASLKSVIGDIITPTRTARSTLQGLEQEIGEVSAKIAAIKGPFSSYREELQRLRDIQRSLSGQASLVDNFNREVVALRAARTEYSEARADVLRYAEATRQSATANAELQNSLRNAQVRLEGAAKGLQAQVVQTRAVRQSARDAGIATNDLASAQSRLLSSVKNSVGALRQLEDAQSKYGVAANRAASGGDFFNNSGRTTLSLVQRIRGEVLSLVAAYVGLYGAIQGAGSVIEAFNTKQRIRNQLVLVVGNDINKINAEYEYLAKTADRLGISFEAAAEGYVKFASGAIRSGASLEETKFIFEQFSTAARVLGLSAEKQGLVFKALTDIMSKGSIQAEELKGQLGDSLPGIFGIAADALKDKFPSLNKAMKDGKVAASDLVAIADELGKSVKDGVTGAVNGLQANQDRLNNTLFEFKNLIAESGFAAEYTKLIESLTKFFNSDDGVKFAKDIADGFGALARGIVFLVENLELVKRLGITIGAIYAGRLFVGIGAGAITAAKGMLALASATTVATTAAKNFNRAFIFAAALVALYEFGQYAVKEFAVVNKAIIVLVSIFQKAWVSIGAATEILWEGIKFVFETGFVTVFNTVTKGTNSVIKLFTAALRALGKNELADAIEKSFTAVERKVSDRGAKITALKAKLAKDLADIDETAVGAFGAIDDDFNNRGKARPKALGTPAGLPAARNNGKTGPTQEELEKAAAKRLAIKERLENELTAIESRIEKNEKDNLERRIAGIDLQYQKLLKQIRKFGGADGAEFEARLTRDVNALKLQETTKFNDALLKEQQSLQTKLEAVEVASGKKSVTDLDSRLNAIKLSYADFYREIAEAETKLTENNRDTSGTQQIKARLDAGILELQNAERKNFILDELARREKAVNDLIEQRSNRIRAVNDEEKAGLLTDSQARVKAADLVKEMQPGIEALADEALEFAINFQGAIDPTKLELFISAMNLAKVSGNRLNTELFTAASLSEMLANGASNAFEGAAQSIGNAIVGTETWGDAIEGVARSFGQFAADFLRQIAMMIIKQQLLNLLQSSGGGGGFLGTVASALNGLVLHSGGVVGKNNNRSRSAPAEWFANAPRYHTGGIAGLAPNEVPAILQKNEEVLARNDPRNALNGGGKGGDVSVTTEPKIINVIDPAMAGEFMQSKAGEKIILNYITRNPNAIKAALNN